MKSKSIFIFCLLIILACKSHEPFSSRKDKKESIQLIKKNIELSDLEYNLIKVEDTIIYELGLSIKDSVRLTLIERRIDSFILRNYTKKEFIHMLKIDRSYSGENSSIEFDRDVGDKKYPKFETIEEGKRFVDSIFSNLSKGIKVEELDKKIKQDSLEED